MDGRLAAAAPFGPSSLSFFFFNDTATTEIYTLSLHDALPIRCSPRRVSLRRHRFDRHYGSDGPSYEPAADVFDRLRSRTGKRAGLRADGRERVRRGASRVRARVRGLLLDAAAPGVASRGADDVSREHPALP